MSWGMNYWSEPGFHRVEFGSRFNSQCSAVIVARSRVQNPQGFPARHQPVGSRWRCWGPCAQRPDELAGRSGRTSSTVLSGSAAARLWTRNPSRREGRMDIDHGLRKKVRIWLRCRSGSTTAARARSACTGRGKAGCVRASAGLCVSVRGAGVAGGRGVSACLLPSEV